MKTKFFNYLEAVRNKKCGFSGAYQLCEISKKFLRRNENCTDELIEGISSSIRYYWANDRSFFGMGTVYLLSCLDTAIKTYPQKASLVYAAIRPLADMEMLYQKEPAVSAAKALLAIAKKCEKHDKDLDYAAIADNLMTKNPWLKAKIEA